MIWCRCEDSQVGTHSNTPYSFSFAVSSSSTHWHKKASLKPKCSFFFHLVFLYFFLVEEKREKIYLYECTCILISVLQARHFRRTTNSTQVACTFFLTVSFWFWTTMYTFHTHIILFVLCTVFSTYSPERKMVFLLEEWKCVVWLVWYGTVQYFILFFCLFRVKSGMLLPDAYPCSLFLV